MHSTKKTCQGGARRKVREVRTKERARGYRSSPQSLPELVGDCGIASFAASCLVAMLGDCLGDYTEEREAFL
jgi:hypothetical protein